MIEIILSSLIVVLVICALAIGYVIGASITVRRMEKMFEWLYDDMEEWKKLCHDILKTYQTSQDKENGNNKV